MFAICSYFEDELKTVKKAENAIESGHIAQFIFDKGIIKAKVQASMKNKTYDVQVRKLGWNNQAINGCHRCMLV